MKNKFEKNTRKMTCILCLSCKSDNVQMMNVANMHRKLFINICEKCYKNKTVKFNICNLCEKTTKDMFIICNNDSYHSLRCCEDCMIGIREKIGISKKQNDFILEENIAT